MSARPLFPDIYVDPEDPNELYQGDIIQGITVTLPDLVDQSSIVAYVVANTTCDLHTMRIDHILLIPVRPLEFFIKERTVAGEKKDRIRDCTKRIVLNMASNSFFLPPTDRFGSSEPHYAELSIMFVLPLNKELKEELVGCRVASVASPCREKLGFVLGCYFSRIGIPPGLEVDGDQLKPWQERYVEDVIKIQSGEESQ